jgi:hypothetical protein
LSQAAARRRVRWPSPQQGQNEHVTVRDLLDKIKRSSACAVLIAGASAHALAAR